MNKQTETEQPKRPMMNEQTESSGLNYALTGTMETTVCISRGLASRFGSLASVRHRAPDGASQTVERVDTFS
jgi:hypothetical protein